MTRAIQSLNLLVVDDDDEFRASFSRLLGRGKHRVVGACDLAGARRELSSRTFDAVLADQNLGDGRGDQLLEDPCRSASTDVVIVTGHASVHSAVDALRRGAVDYLTKPTDPVKLEATLARLARAHALRPERESQILVAGTRLGAMIGRSPAMQPVFDLIRRVAPTDANVLIQGESGTGKELVAEAVHALSRRSQAPLVALNCGALQGTLLESELFGHEKGSFTGADRLHRGFFERADGGTLFLDEITEMPLAFQVKLLRVLESGFVQRVGGTTPIRTDVRLLAATNRDPLAAIREGKLREDLYFRLAVFPIRLPPLRARTGDVELLGQHFLDEQNRVHGTCKRWKAGVLEALELREWRGNARELRNWVQRAYILADEVLEAEPGGAGVGQFLGAAGDGVIRVEVGASISDLERELILATLEHVGGDKAAAASILGISVKTLYNRLSVYAAAAP